MVKKFVASFLIFVVALSCSGCFAVSTSDNQNSSNGEEIILGVGKLEDSSIQTEAEETVLTLDDAEVKLVYTEGDYLLLAYYGPQEDLGIHYCNSDGSALTTGSPDYYYWQFDTGWRLIQTYDLPDGVTVENVGISITDYNVDSKPERVFSNFGEPISDEELAEMGVTFIEGLPCNVTDDDRVSYGKTSFMFTVYFQWMAEARKTDVDSWPFTKDNFTFFAGDGTSLDEAFPGYKMDVRIFDFDGGALDVEFYSKDSNEETNKSMCDELRKAKPYMIYTGDDGSTLRIELLEENRN